MNFLLKNEKAQEIKKKAKENNKKINAQHKENEKIVNSDISLKKFYISAYKVREIHYRGKRR